VTTVVHLLRHGQSDCTRADRFCGRHDPALNDVGHAMAEAAAAAAPRFGAVYTSPAARASETAEIVARRVGSTPHVLADLQELDYGDWDDLPKSAVEGTSAYEAWLGDPVRFAPPGGESAGAVAARAGAAIDWIVRRHEGEEVLVVTHKATIRILVCHELGAPVKGFRDRVAAPTGSLTSFAFGPRGPMLLRLADVAHLPAPWRADADHATLDKEAASAVTLTG
jgi:broad specificity phosphatase PhoE